MKDNNRKNFWKNKKVFITGHTGFKGAWTSIFLNELGARVVGYALKPQKKNNLFLNSNLEKHIFKSYIGDILDKNKLKRILVKTKPDIIIHMAAQSLVRKSYQDPVSTFNINCIGTANILDVVRKINNIKLILVTTSDKVYDIRLKKTFTENDTLNGIDPYSSSKVCQENVVFSYFESYFKKRKSILTTRSGNILGGGDFSDNRIVPDYFRAYANNTKLKIRNQNSTRPWQHVLDAVDAYLSLIEKFYNKFNTSNEISFNNLSNKSIKFIYPKKNEYSETQDLKISPKKIKKILGWENKLKTEETLKLTLSWYLKYFENKKNSYEITLNQIKNYLYLK
jgi:CDP-glucose 4,6-dehydratase